MTAVSAPIVLANCVACGRPLTDPVSADIGIGPDCRAQYGCGDDILTVDIKNVLRGLVSQILEDAMMLKYKSVRESIFSLHERGFPKLATQIDRRLSRRMAEQEALAQQMEIALAAPSTPPTPESLGFTPTDDQNRASDAVRRVMQTPGYAMAVIAGFAGTGKSTALRIFAAEHGTPICVTPTGKAALRVREATGLDASTIHRWLYTPVEDPKSGAITFKPTDNLLIPKSRLVLLDESSMVGPDVWKDLHIACKRFDLKLICVGDPFQLPPVQKPGQPPFSLLLPDFAASLGAERVEMTEVLRQAQGSPVIRASMQLRNGGNVRALQELHQVTASDVVQTAVRTHLAGGVTICHKNTTRFTVNAALRTALGKHGETPEVGEPLMVLKNTYEAGVLNGETVLFEGWKVPPDTYEHVKDRFTHEEEDVRFGATTIGGVVVSLALEELHGRTKTSARAISIAASRWARMQGLYTQGELAPHVSANFGYCYTAHKSQGSEWPFVLVILEPSIRLNEEEGRRWMYTSVTRAKTAVAIYAGRI